MCQRAKGSVPRQNKVTFASLSVGPNEGAFLCLSGRQELIHAGSRTYRNVVFLPLLSTVF